MPTIREYDRARALSQFAADVRRGVRVMMGDRKPEYRWRCIKGWQYYLEHGKPPEVREKSSQIPRTKAPGLVPNSFDTPP